MKRLVYMVFAATEQLLRIPSLVGGEGLVELFRRIAQKACLVLGPISLIFAIGFTTRTTVFLHRSLKASGHVVQMISQRAPDDGTVSFAPVFTFQSVDGGTYTVTSNTLSAPPEFAVGQTVPILYEQARPAAARIATFWQLWTEEFVLGVIGVVFTLTGVFLLKYQRWLDRRGLAVTPAQSGAANGLQTISSNGSN